MSIQELAFKNSYINEDGKRQGNLDLYGKDIYCKSINIDSPTQALFMPGMVISYLVFNLSQPPVPNGFCLCDGNFYISSFGSEVQAPDLRNAFVRGLSNYQTIGFQTGGSNITTLTADNLPSITSRFATKTDTTGSSYPTIQYESAAAGDPQYINSTSIGTNNTPFSNVPQYVGLIYIMKL